MANIIWSFGIALKAEDDASGAITAVSDSMSAMDRSLAQLNERQLENIETVKSLSREYLGLQSAIEGVNYTQAADSASNLSSTLSNIGSVTQASGSQTSLALEGLLAVVSGGTELLVFGVLHLINGLITAIETGASLVFKGIGNLVKFTLKGVESTVVTTLKLVKGAFIGLVSEIPSLLSLPSTAVGGLINLLVGVPTAIFGWASRKYDTYITPIVNAADTVFGAISRVIHLGDDFYPLEHSLNNISVQMGLGSGNTKEFVDQIQHLTLATGLSVDETSQLAIKLGQAGLLMQQIGNYPGIGADKVKTIALLADRFGLGADQAVQFSRSAELLGLNFQTLAARTADFQTKFGVPNLMQVLPEVTNMAQDALGQFGKSVVGDQGRLIESTLKTASAFSKVYGKDIRESVGIARNSFNTFASAMRQDQDVMLGLNSSFSGLSVAMMQSGFNLNQISYLLNKGQKSSILFADSVAKALDKMDPRIRGYALRNISQYLDPETQRLLNNRQELEAAVSAYKQASDIAGSSGISAFSNMSEGLTKTTKGALTIFNNLTTAIRASFGAILSRNIQPFIEKTNEFLARASKSIIEFAKDISTNPQIIGIINIVDEISESLLGIEISSGSASDAFGKFLNKVDVAQILTNALKIAKKTMEGLRDTIISIKKDGLFAYIKSQIRESVDFLSSIGTTLNTILGPTLKDWADQIDSKWTFIKLSIRTSAEDIGNTVGNAVKTSVDFISDMFTGKTSIRQSWEDLKNYFVISTQAEDDKSILGSVKRLASRVAEGTKEALTGFSDGFLSQFGTTTSTALDMLSVKLERFSNTAISWLQKVEDIFYSISDIAIPTFTFLGKAITGVVQYAVMPLVADLTATYYALAKLSAWASGGDVEAVKKDEAAAVQRLLTISGGLASLQSGISGVSDSLSSAVSSGRKSLGARVAANEAGSTEISGKEGILEYGNYLKAFGITEPTAKTGIADEKDTLNKMQGMKSKIYSDLNKAESLKNKDVVNKLSALLGYTWTKSKEIEADISKKEQAARETIVPAAPIEPGSTKASAPVSPTTSKVSNSATSYDALMQAVLSGIKDGIAQAQETQRVADTSVNVHIVSDDNTQKVNQNVKSMKHGRAR